MSGGSGGPPTAVLAAAALVALGAMGLAAVGHATGLGHVRPVATPLVARRALLFHDEPGGSVLVTDATTGATILHFARGQGIFVRGTLRAVARERAQRGVGADVPVSLSRWGDGRLTLDDSATATHVELAGFGPANEGVFSALLGR